MQKYVLVTLLEARPEGTEFSAVDWPLHVTLASNFVVDWEDKNVFEKLSALLAHQKPVITAASGDDYFGPQKQVHVTTLTMTDELQSLHNDIVFLLKSLGATFDEPHYLGEGYRAHATVQSKLRLHTGDSVTIASITAVDMLPLGDIRRRKMLGTVHFS